MNGFYGPSLVQAQFTELFWDTFSSKVICGGGGLSRPDLYKHYSCNGC